MTTNQSLKTEIRQTVRKIRNRLSPAEKNTASHQLIAQIEKQQILHKHQHIACFLSFDGEISTQPVIQQLWHQQKTCYLPKLRPFKPNRLWFLPYFEESTMINNRFAIPEVDLLPNHAKAVSQLDIVLLPLVAFDGQGSRLGMGGGFYDATFSHLRNLAKRPRFIGLAYQAQLVENLPSDPWDLPLDGVCTEENYYRF